MISQKANKLVQEFAAAVDDYSWMGSKEPCTYNSIKKNYRDTKKALYDYIEELERTTNNDR